MKHFIFFLFVIIVTVHLFSRCTPSPAKAINDETAKKSYVKKQSIKVNAEKVEQTTFSLELISNGILTAKEKAELPFEVNEQLLSVEVIEGQKVVKGQLLAKVDPFTYQKQMNDAQNNYDKSLIDLEDLLLGHGYTLKDTAKVPVNVLKMCKIQSGYITALSTLKEAKRNLSNTNIKAPINGVVSNLQAKKNNHSSQYDYCCRIIDNSIMQVVFYVLEGELNMVKKGQEVKTFPFAMPDISKKGTITSVNPAVENGLIKITAEIPNKDGELIDGMSVKILIKKNVPNCIVIPKSAVLYRQNRKVVFVYKDGLAHWVYVETGMENSTQVCITDGSLKPGEEVIVSNNLNLAHETPVVLSNAENHKENNNNDELLCFLCLLCDIA